MSIVKHLLIMFCFLLFLSSPAHGMEGTDSLDSHGLAEAVGPENSGCEGQACVDAPVDTFTDDGSQAVVQAPVDADSQPPLDTPIPNDDQAMDITPFEDVVQAPPIPKEKKILDDSAEVGLSVKVWSLKLNDSAADVCLEHSMIFDNLDWTDFPGGQAPGCQDFSQDLMVNAVKGQLKPPLEIINSLEKIGYASVIVSSAVRAKNHEIIPVQAGRREASPAPTPGVSLGVDLSVMPIIKEDANLTLEYSINIPTVKSLPFPRQADLKIGEILVLAASEENAPEEKSEKNIIIITISTEPVSN